MGVAQSAQGKGLGTLLMTPTLGRCDEERLPAYLEATSSAARRDLKPILRLRRCAELTLATARSADRREEPLEPLSESRRGGDEVSGAWRYEPTRVKRCGKCVADPLRRSRVTT